MERLKTAAVVVATWEWLIILGLIAVALVPGVPSTVLLALLPVLWFVRKAATGRFFQATPFDLTFVVLIGSIIISWSVMFDPSLSLPKLTNLVLSLGLYYAVVSHCRIHPNGLWHILVATCAIGTGMAAVGLLGGEWNGPLERLNVLRTLLPGPLQAVPGTVGGLVNANELAGALAWVAPLLVACTIGLWRSLRGKRTVLRLLLLFSATLVSLVLVSSMSRGGIIGFAVGLGLVVALFVETRWRIVVLISLAVGALGMYFTYSNPQAETDVLGDALGLSGRVEIWANGVQALSDFPLTGTGFNGFREVVGVLYPLFETAPEVDLAHAHNHFLQTGLDLGLIGLVAYVAIWLVAALLLGQAIRKMRHGHITDYPHYAMAVGLAGSLLAGWVFGLADAIALGARPAFVWWLLLGLTAAVHQTVYFKLPVRTRSRRRNMQAQEQAAATQTVDPPPQPAEEEPASRRPPMPKGAGNRPLSPRHPSAFDVAGDEDVGIITI